jgi:localization factor PodJL
MRPLPAAAGAPQPGLKRPLAQSWVAIRTHSGQGEFLQPIQRVNRLFTVSGENFRKCMVDRAGPHLPSLRGARRRPSLPTRAIDQGVRHRRRPYRGFDDDDPEVIGETLADVTDRLDELAQQVARIARKSAPADDRDDADNLGEALAELNRRLDQIEKAEREAARERARTEWLPQFEQPKSGATAPAVPVAPVTIECAQDFSSLENHLRQITDQIAALNKPCQIDDALLGLRKDLADIGRAFNDAMPRRAVEQLEKEIRALSERIDRSRESGANGAKLVQLEAALLDMHETLRNLKPAENLVEISQAVKTLASKIDQVTNTGQNPATLQKLDQVIAGLRGIVGHVASNDALGKLTTEVKNLTARIEQTAPENSAKAISSLDQRITSLLGSRPAASPELAMQISELDRKFEQRMAALMGAKQSAPPDVTSRIQALGEHLDRRLDSLKISADVPSTEIAAHIQALGEHLDRRLDALTPGAGSTAGPEVAAHIQALAEHLDSRLDALMAASPSGAHDVGARIQALAEQLESHIADLAARTASPELTAQIKALTEKIETLRLPQGDKVALSSIEDRIVKLAGKLDNSDTLLSRLSAIERGMADLLVHLEDVRAQTEKSRQAVSKAEHQVHAELAAPETIHSASEPRLQMREPPRHRLRDVLPETSAETNGAGPLPTIETATEAPAQPAAPDYEVESAEAAAESATAAAEISAVKPEPASPLATPIYASVLEPDAPARRPIDPSLPPDTPIEPATEAAQIRASAAQRISASQTALGTPKPVAREVASQFETLIAARRAAFQANAESAGATDSALKGPAIAGPGSQLGQRLRTYLRYLLLLASLVIIIWAALWVGFDMWGGSNEQTEAPTISDQPIDKPQSPEVAGPTVPAPAPAPGKSAPAMPMPSPGPEPGPASPPDLPSTPPANGSGTEQPQGNTSKPMPEVTGTLPKQPQLPSRATELALPASIGGPGLRAQALAGNPAAEYEVAVRFAEGRGVTANIDESARWLERAANAGFVPAQFRLGGLYDKGGGLKRDRNLARQYYTAAAEKGHAKAMHNLAVLYAEGVDGRPNYKMAAQWFRRAAEYGIADSQYNLAILYIRGIGVEQNLAEAYKWFTLAANQGDQEAARKREELAERLDEQSITAANQAAQTFVIAQQPDQAVNLRTPPGGWDRVNAGAQPATPRPAAPSRLNPPPAPL